MTYEEFGYFFKNDNVIETESYGKIKEEKLYFSLTAIADVKMLNSEIERLGIPYTIKIELDDLSLYPENEKMFFTDRINTNMKSENYRELEVYRMFIRRDTPHWA